MCTYVLLKKSLEGLLLQFSCQLEVSNSIYCVLTSHDHTVSHVECKTIVAISVHTSSLCIPSLQKTQVEVSMLERDWLLDYL